MTSQFPQLLVDTDAFCKLAAADLLDEVLMLLGVSRAQCALLPTLTYMLKRGRLRRRYGDFESDRLHKIASEFPVAPDPSDVWLDALSAESSIDIGEARLFALSADHGIPVLTGDKRALEALAKFKDIHPHLSRKLITLEAAVRGLVEKVPDARLREKGSVLSQYDQMAKVVFASTGSDLGEALDSYIRDVESRAKPLRLWRYRE